MDRTPRQSGSIREAPRPARTATGPWRGRKRSLWGWSQGHACARSHRGGSHASPNAQPHGHAALLYDDSRRRVLSNFRETVKDGITLGKTKHPVEVIVKDSQSNPNRAADVAKELIVRDKIDLMLVASTPETTNPVSTQCEIDEVACISTMAPWQPWFVGRQANPAGGPPSWKPFSHTY